ncbi:MAG: hypothetical protein COU69_03480 [Candidatus Pacebacteria bacterium CG10_big_fil_rev_8_21_14_0_10_56_10]|nr:MAG: hypothetical protein COU69_03480 [Candidatus Pacebacteria bacterium CG10_big_fil_rev_8_21_14_0_10_56_10]
MPSSRQRRTSSRSRRPGRPGRANHLVFLPFLLLTFVLWVTYRALFRFDPWFDELIGKAIFFGLPVWLYVVLSDSRLIADSLDLDKLQVGLLRGLAFGGTFGFAAAAVALVTRGSSVAAADLFDSPQFWWTFLLALMTAWWETVFFFSWIMTSLWDKYRYWAPAQYVLAAALIFLVFHLPNVTLRFDTLQAVWGQVLLLGLFGLGQALLFVRDRNAYTLLISHAIWGMVLLVHWPS